MPHPASSPTSTRPQGVLAPAFGGARRGVVRWSAELGEGRHATDRAGCRAWHHVVPESPLVRADGVVLTDWHGVLRAHDRRGRLLWERDLVRDPTRVWAEFWGRLSYVDAEDGAWLVTREGLLRVAADGELRVVNPAVSGGGFSPGVGRILPWGGFVRSYGTDEHYWTRHWPCQESVVEVLDGEGRVRIGHAMGLAPERVYVLGGRIVAFFYDANDHPSRRGAALVLAQDGSVVERVERGAGEDDRGWRYGVLVAVAAAQGLPEPFVGPDEYRWHAEPPAAVPDGSRAYGVSPVWGETVRLLSFVRGVAPAELARDVSADRPTIDRAGTCYFARVLDDRLWLVGLDGAGERFACPLLDGPRLERYVHPHGGRPAEVWRATRWFHSPTALGPDDSTLVLTNLGPGCCLYCVE
jgi:hypothetical protein